jgi:hypothetical protein
VKFAPGAETGECETNGIHVWKKGGEGEVEKSWGDGKLRWNQRRSAVVRGGDRVWNTAVLQVVEAGRWVGWGGRVWRTDRTHRGEDSR